MPKKNTLPELSLLNNQTCMDLIYKLYCCPDSKSLLEVFKHEVLKHKKLDGYIIYSVNEEKDLIIEDILLPKDVKAMEKVLKKSKLQNHPDSFFLKSLELNKIIFLDRSQYEVIHGDLKNHFDFWHILYSVIVPVYASQYENQFMLYCFNVKDPIDEKYIDELKEFLELILLKLEKEIKYNLLFQKEKEIQTAYHKNQKVLDIAEKINNLTSLENVYKYIIKEILALFHFDIGFIFIQNSNFLYFTDSTYIEEPEFDSIYENMINFYERIEGYPIKSEAGATPTSYLRNTHFFFEDLSKYLNLPMSHIDKEILSIGEKSKTLLIFPINQNNHPIGTFQFWSFKKNIHMKESDFHTIKILSSFIGKAISNSILYSLVESQRKELEFRNKMVAKEMNLAKRIQKNIIIQQAPETSGLRFSFLYKPLEEVGGDFYDIIQFDEPNLTGFFICDVSGHGIPAALITVMAKIIIETAGDHKYYPDQLMHYINDKMLPLISDNYLTAIYTLYDSKKQLLKFSGAAHPPFLVIKKDGRLIPQKSKSVMIGIFKNFESFVDEIHLEKNDKIIFFTDGFLESRSKSEKKLEMLFYQLIQKNYTLPVEKLLKIISDEFFNTDNNQLILDDICIIGMEVQ